TQRRRETLAVDEAQHLQEVGLAAADLHPGHRVENSDPIHRSSVLRSILSFPRRRESTPPRATWMPAFAGMTSGSKRRADAHRTFRRVDGPFDSPAAADRAGDRRDQLVDRRPAVEVGVEVRTLDDRHGTKTDARAEDELVNRDVAVLIAVAD